MTAERFSHGPEQVVLVDENDRDLGHMEKIAAHREGLLHRAFSVFIFNRKGELLLQQRAKDKYHSGGLWTNTCCGHPRPGEATRQAAERRLKEEMGISATLRPAYRFVYRVDLDDGLSEHELDHVFVGTADGDPRPDSSEAMDWRRVGRADLEQEIDAHPALFTAWFPLCVWQAWDAFTSVGAEA